jgi:hypothetical protein
MEGIVPKEGQTIVSGPRSGWELLLVKFSNGSSVFESTSVTRPAQKSESKYAE